MRIRADRLGNLFCINPVGHATILIMQLVTRVWVSLGSNLGDRADNIRSALELLNQLAGTKVRRVSALYETTPVGYEDQPLFLNAAAEVETTVKPLELLAAVKNIEQTLGRVPGERWGPRLIDIDIILYDTLQYTSETLTIPHVEFRRRAFVLIPLAEIAPEICDPDTRRTVAELAESLTTTDQVKLYQS